MRRRDTTNRKQYDSIAKTLFKKFKAYAKSGLTRSQAIKRIKIEEGLQYYTTEVYIVRGRELYKQERYNRIKKQYGAGKYSINELARRNKLAYSTVKRIINP